VHFYNLIDDNWTIQFNTVYNSVFSYQEYDANSDHKTGRQGEWQLLLCNLNDLGMYLECAVFMRMQPRIYATLRAIW